MKTKALISFAVTAKLICVFVFAYAKIRFSHDKAHINPRFLHILSWKKQFPSFPDTRCCQLLAKEWALDTGKMPPGQRLSEEQCANMNSAVYHGRKASNQTPKLFYVNISSTLFIPGPGGYE